MATLKEKLEMLSNNVWETPDIMNYFNVTEYKAVDIKKKAIAKGGATEFSTSSVTVDSVMEICSTTREREVKIISHALDLMD